MRCKRHKCTNNTEHISGVCSTHFQPLKCSKCDKIDDTTDILLRCTDCATMKRKDDLGRLLASRCRDCCPSGHGKHKPIATYAINLAEHAELLNAVQHELESRLLAVDTPALTLSHAEGLEERAQAMLDMAQRIRTALAEDTEQAIDLTRQLVKVKMELHLVRYCQQLKIKVTSRGYLENVVRQMFKK